MFYLCNTIPVSRAWYLLPERTVVILEPAFLSEIFLHYFMEHFIFKKFIPYCIQANADITFTLISKDGLKVNFSWLCVTIRFGPSLLLVVITCLLTSAGPSPGKAPFLLGVGANIYHQVFIYILLSSRPVKLPRMWIVRDSRFDCTRGFCERGENVERAGNCKGGRGV